MPGKDDLQKKVSEDTESSNVETFQKNRGKSKNGSPPFSFLSLFKPKSATKVPKAASQKIPKPSIKTPTLPIKPPGRGSAHRKKVFIYVIAFLVLVILVLLAAVILKKRPEPTVGERGKLTWWGQREEFLVQPLIEKYEEKNPEVTIDYRKQDPIDYRVRLQNLMEKGEAPDIFSLHNSWVPMFLGNLDTLPSNVMEKQEYENIFYPAIVSSLQNSRGFLGIPIGYDALVLYINRDIFTTAFANPPETWDDFRQLAYFLTDAPGDRIIQAGAAMGLTENVNHWEEIIALLMVQNGVSLANPKGERAGDVFEYYTSFSGGKGRVWDQTLPESVLAFANGKLAMLLAPTYRANEIRKVNPDLNFITVPVPQAPQAEPEIPDVTYATFWFEGVWKRSVNNDIAWDFLEFMVDRDNQIEISNIYQRQGLVAEAYPRKDMRVLLKDDLILGPVVNLAESSFSWYLAGDTKDGDGGINDGLSRAFKVGVKEGGDEKYLLNVSEQVRSVLSRYGLTPRR